MRIMAGTAGVETGIGIRAKDGSGTGMGTGEPGAGSEPGPVRGSSRPGSDPRPLPQAAALLRPDAAELRSSALLRAGRDARAPHTPRLVALELKGTGAGQERGGPAGTGPAVTGSSCRRRGRAGRRRHRGDTGDLVSAGGQGHRDPVSAGGGGTAGPCGSCPGCVAGMGTWPITGRARAGTPHRGTAGTAR